MVVPDELENRLAALESQLGLKAEVVTEVRRIKMESAHAEQRKLERRLRTLTMRLEALGGDVDDCT